VIPESRRRNPVLSSHKQYGVLTATGYNIAIMAGYPICLKLKDRHVVLIGGGKVALRKARDLCAAGARLLVVSRQFDAGYHDLCRGYAIERIQADYTKSYLTSAALVIAATNSQSVNEQVYHDCRSLGILCNVVDRPELCDFYVPAVVSRGDLQIAISTNGTVPAFSAYARRRLESVFTDTHGEFLAQLHWARKETRECIHDARRRKTISGQLAGEDSFRYFARNGSEAWRRYATDLMAEKN